MSKQITYYKNQQKQIMKRTRLIMLAAFATVFFNSCTKEDLVDQQIVEGTISTNTIWVEGDNYIIRGNVYIDNASLTIQPGTTVRFEAGASLSIGYSDATSITAVGTVDKPITFTSTLDSPTAGSWQGIFLYDNNSSNSSFRYCTFKYAGTNDYGSLNLSETSCAFSNNVIQYSKKLGIRCIDENSYFVEMNNNTISEGGSHAVRISATKAHTIGTGNTFTCADGFGINLWGSNVTGTVTWKNLTTPYFVEGQVFIDNSTFTIEAGTILKFDTNGVIKIGYNNTATFIANGTPTSKITFTSSASSPASGAWDGIWFYDSNLQNSSMTNCEVAYAGKSNEQAIYIQNTKLTFSTNNVHHSNETAIITHGSGSFVEMNNNTISNCGKHAIIIGADYFHTVGTGNTLTTASDMGIYLTEATINSSVTWKKQTVAVIINNYIHVDNTLTIEAGSILKFGADGDLWFGLGATAQLNAIGTSINPIVFTAWSATPSAGAWAGLYFDLHTSSNTTLDYCEVKYAGKGSDQAAIYMYGVNGMTIKNTKLQYSEGWGIFKENSILSAGSTGNTFLNCALGDEGELSSI